MADCNPDGSLKSPAAFVAALRQEPSLMATIRASNAMVCVGVGVWVGVNESACSSYPAAFVAVCCAEVGASLMATMSTSNVMG